MFSVLLLSSCGSESAETVQENKYEVLIENSCGFDKDVINKKVYAFASDIDADNALEKIMKLTGLPPNFEIKAANVDNACAVVECDDNRGCKRIIYYNQEFIEKMNDATNTDFTELAILAHEIGHHLSGHTIAEPKNRHEEELEADKFAGFILHQLGASIETAKNVFSYFPINGTKTHPPKEARIAAMSNGWYDSKRKGNPNLRKSRFEKDDKKISEYTYYGKEISNNSIELYDKVKEMALLNGIKSCKFSGKIVETESIKGCWMTLDTGEDTLFIRFRDYAFFVPRHSVDGKNAVVQGDLILDTTSVEMLKHYAEDAGKSEEEIALITEPNYELFFIADGVMIRHLFTDW